jgi:UPF0716 protein FxsA
VFARLFLLFSVVPFIELFLLLAVGREIGIVPTIAMIIATALIGAALAKREGLRVYTEWQRAIAEMRVPDEGITSGLLVLVGGALLIAPGVLTDIVGILLMIAPIRRVVARFIEARVKKHLETAAASGAQPGVFRVQTSGFDFRAVSVGPRVRVQRPQPRVIEGDGVLISERRPDAPPRDVIEGEIVE